MSREYTLACTVYEYVSPGIFAIGAILESSNFQHFGLRIKCLLKDFTSITWATSSLYELFSADINLLGFLIRCRITQHHILGLAPVAVLDFDDLHSIIFFGIRVSFGYIGGW